MPLIDPQDEILLSYINSQQSTLAHNKDILCIIEGDLLKYIEAHLKKEFSAQAYAAIEPRISPINYLARIVDKLSKIYQQSVNRSVYDSENQRDQELLDMYVKAFQMNSIMNSGNEYFNAFKTNLNQPFIDETGHPRLRAISNERFLVYSNNKIDQTIPTHVILPYGQNVVKVRETGGLPKNKVVDVFKIFTKDSIYLLDEQGNRSTDQFNPEGINPFGVLPFMYANKSNSFLMPPVDSDTKRMAVLLPVLMSDLNYAVKFQSFSMLYVVDADSNDIKLNPNAILELKSDPNSDKKPEIGQIKPQVDIPQVIELITTQLSLWLNSKNIRPGSISDLSASDPVSGISKLVDEMDTSDARKKQVEVYKSVEERFWLDLMHRMHPVWIKQGVIKPEFRFPFSPSAKVDVNFPEQLPMLRRGQLVKDVIEEMNNGLVSRETALRKVNPEWTKDQLDEELEKITNQGTVVEDMEETTQMTETGSTSTDANHKHNYTIDFEGNGMTDVVDGHSHEISGGSVSEADGHTHTITRDTDG